MAVDLDRGLLPLGPMAANPLQRWQPGWYACLTMGSVDRSPCAFDALHGLRLKGLAETAALVALCTGGDEGPEVLDPTLRQLAAEGLVAEAKGAATGWRLTNTGRARHEQLLAERLDRTPGARAAVEAAYDTFTPLNRRLLELCTRWQVLPPNPGDAPDAVVLNRHDDPAYDAAVLADLDRMHDEATTLLDKLIAVDGRFDLHRRRLVAAHGLIRHGGLDWFTSPVIDSYHTVWFEWHEDLLATLGLDRATETARIDAD